MMTGTSRSQPGQPADLNTLLNTLDRLEELIEEMAELGVTSRDEAEARMREIHAQVDELETPAPEH